MSVKNNIPVEERKDNTIDWHDLNRLIKIIQNFQLYKNGRHLHPNAPRAAFRITMNDNKPVFGGASNCKCPENAIAGVASPKIYTKNTAGNRTAPYAFIKPPVSGDAPPGGVVFVPPVSDKKKNSFVDVVTWNNSVHNNEPGKKPVVIHPEQQFLHWLRMQKAKDPDFVNRINKINMRMAHVPCKNCAHTIASKLTRVVGAQPKINIRVSDNKNIPLKTPVINFLNRHPSITIKSVPSGIKTPAIQNKVLGAITERHLKHGVPAHQIARHQASAGIGPVSHIGTHNPLVKGKVGQAIVERKMKQGVPVPHSAHMAATALKPGFVTSNVNPVIKSKVGHAIAERHAKQGIPVSHSLHAATKAARHHFATSTANPVVKSKVGQAIAERQIKQGVPVAHTAHKAAALAKPGFATSTANPVIKSKVGQAIVERQIKQGVPVSHAAHVAAKATIPRMAIPVIKSKAATATAPHGGAPKASPVVAAQAKINNLKQMHKEMEHFYA